MAGNSVQNIFSQAENRTLGALNFVQGALKKRSIPLTKKIEFDLDWSETLYNKQIL